MRSSPYFETDWRNADTISLNARVSSGISSVAKTRGGRTQESRIVVSCLRSTNSPSRSPEKITMSAPCGLAADEGFSAISIGRRRSPVPRFLSTIGSR